ncbi:GNAT family N-acetyltransferase [Thiomicrospira pelophila]|uniref:GNAT family N-acetyltransferase n=1 Tax=Thiomicrospira pelophila TaxID=934 RepID=UPI0004A6E320|nr:N-acetyltransferase [Thiomicrospira pelophila]
MPLQILSHSPNDIPEIQAMVTRTFSDSEGAEEGKRIGFLAFELLTQTPEQDVFCFLAKEDNNIIGCIICSRLFFAHGLQAFILAPVAVTTEFQGQRIGQQLIQFGLQKLKQNGIELVFTYGDPNYYSKVGFQTISEQQIPAPLKLTYPQGWLVQSLTNKAIPHIREKPSCVPALAKPEYW